MDSRPDGSHRACKGRLLLVGHLPPPVTGETICRARMCDALRSLGAEIINVGRCDFRAWFCRPSGVVIVNGASAAGTLYDLFLTLWWGFCGRRVFWYFHNRSWRRFARVPAWVWPIRYRPIPIGITQSICLSFENRGYAAALLRNTPETDFVCKTYRRNFQNRLMFVGRIEESKGFYTAASVFRELWMKDRKWIFDVYGIGDDVQGLVNRYDGAIRLHGWVSGREKVRAYEQGGVLMFPSRYRNETLPMVIIEALSQGIPVVASDVGGICEMIQAPGRPAGIVVRDGLIESYTRAVGSIVTEYERYSLNALEVFRRDYSNMGYHQSLRRVLLEGVPRMFYR